MQINIKTSSENLTVVRELTRKLPGSSVKENVIPRIALGYSLSTGKRFKPDEFYSYDSQGKEYKDNTLFDEQYRDFYIALICQAYGIKKDHEDIAKYIKLHIDHGLEKISALFKDKPGYTFFDFFTDYFSKEIDMIEDTPERLEWVENRNLHIEKRVFSGIIKIRVGYDISKHEPIYCSFNSSRYSNPHIAVAGKSGSGKTQFALEFLRQLHERTQGQVNFLFLDFKGLSKEDKDKMSDFFTETHTECIHAPGTPFPLNPVSFIDNVNEINQQVGINKFVDLIAEYSNLGKKQKQTLKHATGEAFLRHKDGKYPSLKEIYDLIREDVGDTGDSLEEIMERLSEYELFASEVNDSNAFLNKNYYFSLSSGVDETVRFTSTFLIIYYIFIVFTNMGGTEVVNGNKGMRYILMIDEAHELFRKKKSMNLLEDMLRKMHSYGVSIVLLSQGISEYNQGDFDFSQECETAFILPMKDLNNTKAINKFLGLGNEDCNFAMQNLNKLDNGYCVSNIRELKKGDLFEVVQYWKEEKNRKNI